MSDPTDVRAELRLAEERLAKVRARNARLERRLLKPTKLRNRMIATLALAALGGALARVGATHTVDARAARARVHSTEQYEERLAAQRRSLDASKALLQKEQNDILACKAQRDELKKKLLPAPPARLDPRCTCAAGDPLCSCR